MKDSKSKVWLIITVIIGIVTSLIVTNYLKGIQQVVAKEDITTIVIASAKVSQGTRLTSEMVKTIEIPTHNAPKSAVSDIGQVINKFTTVDLWPEDYIFNDKLTTENTSTELMYKIPKGKRAITIAVNTTSGVGGHIKPGHFVDILLKYQPSEKPEGNKAATMLQNIQVLAVGIQLAKIEGAQPAGDVTLAVTPEEAQVITLAEGIGKESLKLILRSSDEKDKTKISSFNLKSLYETYP